MAKFFVQYRFRATASEEVEAASQDDAEELVAKKVDSDNFDLDAEDIDDVRFDVYQMHPVTRDGREIWTTYLLPTDIRGHQSALEKSPLFSGVPDQEAALSGAVAN